MEVGFKSDKGLKRSNNEDACFVFLADKVYLVADGVGGRGNSQQDGGQGDSQLHRRSSSG